MILPDKKNCQFLLLGGGKHICSFTRLLLKNKFLKPIIITYPKKHHERDVRLLKDIEIYENIFKISEEYKITIFDNVVNNQDILKIKKQYNCNILFSLSWRSIISSDVIEEFDNQVFNIHPSFLPLERGSGTFSYRILNNSKEVSATIHFVDKGIDTGDIILQKKSQLNKKNLIPYDYLLNTQKIYVDLFKKFILLIDNKRKLPQIKQNHLKSTYYPLLNTEVNGAINWNLNILEIEKFIRAFSYPYPGAFTFKNKTKKISILKAKIYSLNKKFHPFLIGRIIRIFDNNADIILKDGILRILQIKVNGKIENISDVMSLTTRLHTPLKIIEQSMNSVLKAKEMPIPQEGELND